MITNSKQIILSGYKGHGYIANMCIENFSKNDKSDLY